MTEAARTLESHGWWLVSRASGLVALVLITVSVAIGLAMAGKVLRVPGLSRKLLAVHEQTALAGLIAIAVHAIALLGDPFLDPGVGGVAIPFALDFETFFTGLGVVAAYLAALLGLSFYFRRRIGAKLWRRAHRATVLVWVLGLVHALGAGSDTGEVWFRWWVMATTPLIGGLFVHRVLEGRAKAGKRAKPAEAGRPAEVAS
ncbi:MAG: methionine sulfoxide reductase heme-binding subunit [Solirubrobacterales bacterium]|jgi:sulfoxide reductase heme-binding subunit YedZ|nr:methionine sulfoxide reductase heme-binding subunit [Solirubrobacterales bacterium]